MREKPQQEEDWGQSRVRLEFLVKSREVSATPIMEGARGSIDHSLCFSTGLLELLKVLQDDVVQHSLYRTTEQWRSATGPGSSGSQF